MKVDAARLLVEFFYVSLGSRIGVGIVGVDTGGGLLCTDFLYRVGQGRLWADQLIAFAV